MSIATTNRTTGIIVDPIHRKTFPGRITWEEGRIQQITPLPESKVEKGYLLPGFIDAHIHIESSMLIPTQFAKMAVRHGTVATVSDPHEIANVLGIKGVEYMIQNGRQTPFKFFFGAPSCVPATPFETAGAILDPAAINKLLSKPEIKYLAEMMNFPGVLNKDPDVLEKINIARVMGKPIDGHAPGLMGRDAIRYIAAGISTDHECTTYDEALHKLQNGMLIAIREGSAAKNFEALHPLFKVAPEQLMFCSDDKHPDELVKGHINQLVERSVKAGYDLYDVLEAACIRPIDHYDLEVGRLQPGDPADWIRVSDLEEFSVLQTCIDGEYVYDRGTVSLPTPEAATPNVMNCPPITPEQLKIPYKEAPVRIIVANNGSLLSGQERHQFQKSPSNELTPDTEQDILKIIVYNRYADAEPAMAFVKNFGLRKGAIASSVAHDSHNIIAVGTTDAAIAEAVNGVIEVGGGISCYNEADVKVLPLPVAGLMSPKDGVQVAKEYEQLDRMAKDLGSQLDAPFMTLSFLALLVIPSLKLSDKGLFDGNRFAFTDLFVSD